MSNKETLQQHNTRLSENNVEIENILNIANNLPTVDEVISLQDKTVEPSTSDQVITADGNYNGLGTVTVKGDSDLLPENIKKGVNIFGVEGTASSGANFEINDCQYLFTNDARLEFMNEILPLCKNVTNMCYMFSGAGKITSLDLSSFDTAKVTDMKNMFNGCNELSKIDIRNFTFDKVTSYSNMFNGVPADCEIIVKSDTERDWILTQRSDFANVKTVAEL